MMRPPGSEALVLRTRSAVEVKRYGLGGREMVELVFWVINVVRIDEQRSI